MKRIILALALASTAAVSFPAMAQDTDDIIMRRPLPGDNVPDVGSEPEGPLTPFDPDVPGLQEPDPDDLDPGETPPDDFVPFPWSYVWDIGTWEGDATCGQQSTLRRSVSCRVSGFNGGGGPCGPFGCIGSRSPIPGEPEVQNASLGSVSGAMFRLAGDGGDVSYTVDPQQCAEALGYIPATTYTGDKAGCTYTPEVIEGQWENPYGGSAVCSGDAQRNNQLRCRASDNSIVPEAYCRLNLTSGGSENYIETVEYGNFSGCTADWAPRYGDPYCVEDNKRREVTYVCERSDGTVLEGVEEAACGPLEGFQHGQVEDLGKCFRNYDTSVWDGVAYGHKPSNHARSAEELGAWRVVVHPGSMYSGGAAACAAANATSCQERWNDTLRRVETVGSTQPIRRFYQDYAVSEGSRGYYMDDGNGPVASYGTTTYGPGDEVHHDKASPVRITGARSGFSCGIPVGTVMAGCGIPFGCTSESAYEGWPPPLWQCNPSTQYYQYENMWRVYTYGGSNAKWTPEPPNPGN